MAVSLSLVNCMVKATDKRFRGLMGAQGRITIPDAIREELGIERGTFFEGEVYGEDKILITFIKYKRD